MPFRIESKKDSKDPVYDVADKLAQLLYGKPIKDCIGSAQNICFSKKQGGKSIRDMRIEVIVPEDKCSTTYTKVNRNTGLNYKYTYNRAINSMILHAKKNGISISRK